MNVAQTIAKYLASLGTTDAFGIPGGVILELLYALETQEGITPHLLYHEQSAGFAACGYAQSGGKLGVAYATRGPGFTNLLTPLADAYCDSIPVLFITAHEGPFPASGMRVMADQEIDTCALARTICKECARIDSVEEFGARFPALCAMALSGRKGPVVMDIAAKVLKDPFDGVLPCRFASSTLPVVRGLAASVAARVAAAKRPVLLVGDGVNQAQVAARFRTWAERVCVPVVSSRFSHDVLCGSDLYFGYVGSHGCRAANFMLAKADLIMSLGNRLHFPVSSASFSGVFEHADLIRFDVDETEFSRALPQSENHVADLVELLGALGDSAEDFGRHDAWWATCRTLRARLHEVDVSATAAAIARMLAGLPLDMIVVNDVGNAEFAVSRAAAYSGCPNRTLYSKSFGALGCALGKAIGVHYATKKPVLCVVGDQGLQMNIQELQHIAQHRLPIVVFVVDNGASGMIRDKELAVYGRALHATRESGYGAPEWSLIAKAYGLRFAELTCADALDAGHERGPSLVVLHVDEDGPLTPNLPKGNACQDMAPALDADVFDALERM